MAEQTQEKEAVVAAKPGYKKTKLGWIPEEWEVRPISDYGDVVTGNTPDTQRVEFYGGKFGFVSPGDLTGGKYVFDTSKKLTASGFETGRKVKRGSVLFVSIGSTIGKIAIAGIECITNQQINSVVPNAKSSGEYLFYQLDFHSEKIKRIAGAQAVPILNKTTFAGVRILTPPLPEQRAIAAVLSTWDSAIDLTRRLIETKKARQKGLMQQLLSGKKRLDGFEGEWIRVKAGEIFESVSKKGFEDEELLSVTQDYGVIPRSSLEARVTMPSGNTKSFKLVEPGNFVISLRSFQGGLEFSKYRGVVSPAYTVLEPSKEIEDAFYRHYFKSYDFIGHLAVAVIGIRDGKQISYQDFCIVKIPFPTIEEQRAIATVLSRGEAEIKQSEQYLAALQQQKKGLMQKLLTGEVRVKSDES